MSSTNDYFEDMYTILSRKRIYICFCYNVTSELQKLLIIKRFIILNATWLFFCILQGTITLQVVKLC